MEFLKVDGWCLSTDQGCALLLLHEFGLGSQSVHVPREGFFFKLHQGNISSNTRSLF